MKCPWRGCEVDHKSLSDSVEYHKARGEFESSYTCPLDYHYTPELEDGRRYGSRKPSLDFYDRKKN